MEIGPDLSKAYSYITRAMKDYTGHVLGAMRLVANSYAPDELNRLGMHFYVCLVSLRGPALCRLVTSLVVPPCSISDMERADYFPQNEFKPDVEKWGQRGILDCAKILDQVKDSLPTDVEVMARAEDGEPEQARTTKPIHTVTTEEAGLAIAENSAAGTPPELGWMMSDPPDVEDGPISKKPKLSLEEYEAMLDAENGEGGFLEGGAAADVR